MTILLKRAYSPESPDDGFRVYIDRLWPRGRSHEDFRYDLWEKDIAPSTELREWFHEDPDIRWTEFETRYKKELEANPAFKDFCKSLKGKSKITLLYSSHDTVHNNAVIVRDLLESCDGVGRG